MDEIFKQALPVLQKLMAAGFEAYFVGGSVRDFLIGRKIADVDIATSAFPEEVKEIFPKTYDTGIEHGTVTVRENGTFYEITTFRTEGTYEDFRRPKEVTFIRSLTEDLRRRDFTMNAIAMDAAGRFIDPFRGKEAITAKQICAVGDPHERFHEDALRMMRAIRFVSQLDFQLDQATRQALQENKALLAHTAVERKTTEWVKLLQGKAVNKALKLLVDSGVEVYLPGLQGKQEALLQLATWHFSELQDELATWLLLAAAVKPESASQFLRAWKLSNKTIQVVSKAYERLMDYPEEWTATDLYYAGEQVLCLVGSAFEIMYAKDGVVNELLKQYGELPIHSRDELMADGRDLMAWTGKAPGKWLKITIEKLEKEIVQGRLSNTSDAIKRWVVDEESR